MSDEPAEGGPTVVADVLAHVNVVDAGRWGSVARHVLIQEGVHRGHLDLHFVDLTTISELNQEHMGKAGATDVLAFPMDAQEAMSASENDEFSHRLPIHLGDVVICVEVAEQQAYEHAGSVEAELCLLTIHAVLHILGHDHEFAEERTRMQQREQVHMQHFGFSHPGSQA